MQYPLKLLLFFVAPPVVLAGCGGANSTYSPAVTGPGFTLQVNPATNTVAQGGNVAYTVTLTPTDDFDSTVTLSASNLPAEATATFEPGSVEVAGQSVSSALTIATTAPTGDLNGTLRQAAGTPTGTFRVRVTGTGGGISRSQTFDLVVSDVQATPGPEAVVPMGLGLIALLRRKAKRS